MNFATLDVTKFPFLVEPLGLLPNKFPALAIQTSSNTFTFDQDQSITADSVERFIQKKLRIFRDEL
jgi:hypothetical protein